MDKRNCRHEIRSMTVACLSSWFYTPRTVFALVFIILLGFSETNIAQSNLAQQGFTLNWGETIFFYVNNGFNILMSSALFLVMADEIPRQISFQTYALVRTNRYKWLFAQILFCLLLVFIMVILCCSVVMIASVGHSVPGSNWSDFELVEQGYITENEDGIVSAFIRNNFSPFEATMMALAPLIGFWLTMLLTILLFGLWGKSVTGLSICMISLLSSLIIMNLVWRNIPLPIYYATLANICLSDSVTPLLYTLLGYGMIDAALVGTMFFRIRQAELRF